MAFGFVMLTGCQSMPWAKQIVYVAGDGSGMFNCTGTSDQLQINEALMYVTKHPEAGTVYLKGPHVFNVHDTIFIGSNTRLTGDPTAVIRLVDGAGWPRNKPMITMMKGADRNIEICGFEIDGNDVKNQDYDPAYKKNRYGGAYYYTMLDFAGITNLHVHHMKLHNNLNDLLKITRCNGVEYDNCLTYKPGHDGLYSIRSENVKAHHNKFNNRINCAIRLYDSNHCELYENDVTAEGGGNGFQIQRSRMPMNDIEIHDNYLHGVRSNGIRIYIDNASPYKKQDACNVYVHDNRIERTGGAGIGVDNFFDTRIENNMITECGGSGISISVRPLPDGSAGQTIVRKNVIRNTRVANSTRRTTGTTQRAASGVGIRNASAPGKHVVISESNRLSNNPGGNYFGEVQARGDRDEPAGNLVSAKQN